MLKFLPTYYAFEHCSHYMLTNIPTTFIISEQTALLDLIYTFRMLLLHHLYKGDYSIRAYQFCDMHMKQPCYKVILLC